MRQSIGLFFACLLALPSLAVAQNDKKTPNIVDEMKRREKDIKDSEARKEWKAKVADSSVPGADSEPDSGDGELPPPDPTETD